MKSARPKPSSVDLYKEKTFRERCQIRRSYWRYSLQTSSLVNFLFLFLLELVQLLLLCGLYFNSLVPKIIIDNTNMIWITAVYLFLILVITFVRNNYFSYRALVDLSGAVSKSKYFSLLDPQKSDAVLSEINVSRMLNIRANETIMRVFRTIRYFISVFFVVQINFYTHNFPSIYNLTALTFLLGITIILDAFQSLSRVSFRGWPNVLLAVSASLFFFCLTGIKYSPSNLWGLLKLNINTSILEDKISNAQLLITGSALASAVLSIIVFLGQSIYDKYKLKQTSDSAKDTRRRLLSHWHYHPKHQLLSSLTMVIIGFVAASAVALILCMPTNADIATSLQSQNTTTTQTISTDQAKNSTTTQTQTTTTTQAKENNNAQTLLTYLSWMAIAIAFSGLVTHFDISNKALAQSEYLYLLYHSLYLVERQPLASQHISLRTRRKWTDFFQVLSHLFSNESPVVSENSDLHKLSSILSSLYKHGDNCSRTVMLSRSVLTYADIQEDFYLSDVKHNNSSTEKTQKTSNGTICTPIKDTELLFSTAISKLFDMTANETLFSIQSEETLSDQTDGQADVQVGEQTDTKSDEQADTQSDEQTVTLCRGQADTRSSDPLTFLFFLSDAFFDQQFTHSIERQLCISNMTPEGFISIIQNDILCQASHWRTRDDCLLSWLCACDQGINCPCGDNPSLETVLHNRRLFALEYPLLVWACIGKRWPSTEPFDKKMAGTHIKKYYYRFFSAYQTLYTDDNNELTSLAEELRSFVIQEGNPLFFDALLHVAKSLASENDETQIIGKRAICIRVKYNKQISYGEKKYVEDAMDYTSGHKEPITSPCINIVYYLLSKV